ncbi:TPA: hypothetical protein DEA19_00090, partial [Candidatus Uhrbacteria bacterium]|nr:hypothetical protein [Candidatus Uhrbacteria bacterium]HAN06550.1 hypothetical protein [Candidatus Uhrbacteria bacterium]HBR99422.1 hypothetical protein [Candidatus Uhrbacteria bacterium]
GIKQQSRFLVKNGIGEHALDGFFVSITSTRTIPISTPSQRLGGVWPDSISSDGAPPGLCDTVEMGEEKIVRMEMINGFIAKKEAGAVHIVWTAPEARGQFYPAGCSDSPLARRTQGTRVRKAQVLQASRMDYCKENPEEDPQWPYGRAISRVSSLRLPSRKTNNGALGN